jgi:hypothetical protein
MRKTSWRTACFIAIAVSLTFVILQGSSLISFFSAAQPLSGHAGAGIPNGSSRNTSGSEDELQKFAISKPALQQNPPAPSSRTPPPQLKARQHNYYSMSNTSNSDMCNAKYPPHTLRMLANTIRSIGVRKVAIAGLLKDCAYLLPTIDSALHQVAHYLGAKNVFVSLFESRSVDGGATAAVLQEMAKRLQSIGVSNVISSGETERLPMTRDWQVHKRGNRIDYLSKLRNVVLLPILQAFPRRHFDKVFFLNDVYLCGGDILRLLAHDVDMACGLDFKKNRFYDIWVMEQTAKQQLQGHSWDLSLQLPKPPLSFDSDDEESSRRVLACWNGAAAFVTAPLYRGVRFRRGMQELGEGDCSQSECSLWSMDFHNLGYHRIIADPSVQFAYDLEQYFMWFRQPRLVTQQKVYPPLDLDGFNETSYRCCELEGTSSAVDFKKCSRRKLRLSAAKYSSGRFSENKNALSSGASIEACRRNAALCLKYTPARWEVQWEWRQWMRVGNAENTIKSDPITSGNNDSTTTNTTPIHQESSPLTVPPTARSTKTYRKRGSISAHVSTEQRRPASRK